MMSSEKKSCFRGRENNCFFFFFCWNFNEDSGIIFTNIKRFVWQGVYTIHSINQTQTLNTWMDCDYGPISAHFFLKLVPKTLAIVEMRTLTSTLMPIQLHHSGRGLDRIPALQMNSIEGAGVSRQINVSYFWLINSIEFCTYGGGSHLRFDREVKGLPVFVTQFVWSAWGGLQPSPLFWTSVVKVHLRMTTLQTVH